MRFFLCDQTGRCLNERLREHETSIDKVHVPSELVGHSRMLWLLSYFQWNHCTNDGKGHVEDAVVGTAPDCHDAKLRGHTFSCPPCPLSEVFGDIIVRACVIKFHCV